MDNLIDLNMERRDQVNMVICEVRGSLLGIGALFEGQMTGTSYAQDELFGLGQLLKKLARELEEVESLLKE